MNWAGFIPAALLVSLIPGANQLLGLSNAVRHGIWYALAGVGGRLAAFGVLIGLVMGGVGAVLVASATALNVIKWVGVAYLAWIGFAAIRRAWRRPSEAADAAAETRPATAGRGLWPVVVNEFVVAISNPKALLLFAALLPQFTGGTGSDLDTQLVLLGIAYLGIELVVGLGYIGIGGRIGMTGVTARTQRRIDGGTGVCFVGLAGLLAADNVA
ncbi:LysE family translocator [Nonomuraea lactucae]|uniref:LysE family translocator n=1 Tax=Nonomuraea lactucae TaxID=2249762 RepID=UPI000DE47534|nr:LysE family translocator [Nonomuraea lactucae]